MIRLRYFFLLLLLIGCGGDEPQPTAIPLPSSPVPATPVPATPIPTAVATQTAVLPTIAPTPIPPTAVPSPTVFCPDLPRPALLTVAADRWQLYSPQADAHCDLPPLPATATAIQLYEDVLYYLEPETAVFRLTPDGQTTPLRFTQPPAGSFINSYVSSSDGSRIAWTTVRSEADGSSHSRITIADSNGGDQMVAPDIALSDGRFVELVQIGLDNHQLVYAYQPAALAQLDGVNGRYDSLYTSCCGGFPQKLFDCTDSGLTLCLGALTIDGQQIAYSDGQNLVIADADGVVRATVPHPPGLAGYPLFNLAGDLFFYAAPEATPATLYRLPFPYDQPPQPVVSAAGLLPPLRWLGDEQLLVGWRDEEGQPGHALLTVTSGDIQPLPAGQPVATLASPAVPTSSQTELSPNGRWQVRYGQSVTVAASRNELDSFPGGAKYRVFLEVAEVDGPVRHTIVDEWRPAGLGQDWPVPYRWSAAGQLLYWTDAAAVDGCGIFANGTHLGTVDLLTGEIAELLPRFRTLNLALSPNEQTVAFVSHSGEGEQLWLRDLATGQERAWLLDDAPDAQAGNIVWSPDSRGLVVTVAHAPCSQQMRYSLRHVQTDGEQAATTLIDQVAEPFRVTGWPDPSRLRLADDNGASWLLDVVSGESLSPDWIDGLCADGGERDWFFTPTPATCPMAAPTVSPALAQPFEHGMMVWLEAQALVLVLFDGGEYGLFALPPELAAGGSALTPPAGMMEPAGVLTAVWQGQLPLSEDVGERLGWGVASAVNYSASQQLDISSVPPASGPLYVLRPEVTYLGLAGGEVVGLGRNGRYFAAGYMLQPPCFYPNDLQMVGVMLVQAPMPCLVWVDPTNDEAGFRIELTILETGEQFVWERPFNSTYFLLPPAAARLLANCATQQEVHITVTALRASSNSQQRVAKGQGFMECDSAPKSWP